MSYTDIIHRWIQAPSEIKEADYRLLKALKKQYPYFHPLHYLDQYLAAGKVSRRSQPALLYPVNPVLLAEWYASAGSVVPAVSLRSATERPGTFSDGEKTGAVANRPKETSTGHAGGTRPQEDAPADADISAASKGTPAAEGDIVAASSRASAATDSASETQQTPAPGGGLSGSDYFAAQGIVVDDTFPDSIGPYKKTEQPPEEVKAAEEDLLLSKEKELMVVMSFSEWLNYLESRSQKAKEEEASQRAFKARWQQQKLAEALGEETDEIPETVFKMAVSSISRDEEPVSETLAEVYIRQGKKAKAMELYEKLSLQNPEKNAYFAQKIARLKKEIDI